MLVVVLLLVVVVLVVVGRADDSGDGGRADGAGGGNASSGGPADLGVEGEGLGEPEGVRVVFVVVAKLLTLYTTRKERKTD